MLQKDISRNMCEFIINGVNNKANRITWQPYINVVSGITINTYLGDRCLDSKLFITNPDSKKYTSFRGLLKDNSMDIKNFVSVAGQKLTTIHSNIFSKVFIPKLGKIMFEWPSYIMTCTSLSNYMTYDYDIFVVIYDESILLANIISFPLHTTKVSRQDL